MIPKLKIFAIVVALIATSTFSIRAATPSEGNSILRVDPRFNCSRALAYLVKFLRIPTEQINLDPMNLSVQGSRSFESVEAVKIKIDFLLERNREVIRIGDLDTTVGPPLSRLLLDLGFAVEDIPEESDGIHIRFKNPLIKHASDSIQIAFGKSGITKLPKSIQRQLVLPEGGGLYVDLPGERPTIVLSEAPPQFLADLLNKMPSHLKKIVAEQIHGWMLLHEYVHYLQSIYSPWGILRSKLNHELASTRLPQHYNLNGIYMGIYLLSEFEAYGLVSSGVNNLPSLWNELLNSLKSQKRDEEHLRKILSIALTHFRQMEPYATKLRSYSDEFVIGWAIYLTNLVEPSDTEPRL